MFRFGANKLIRLSSSRSLLLSTTNSVRQNVIRSSIKSILACNVQPIDQTRSISYRCQHSSRTISRITTFKQIRSVQTLADADSKEAKDQLRGDLSLDSSPTDPVGKYPNIDYLKKVFSNFEERCKHQERVSGSEFASVFDTMTRLVEQYEVLELSPEERSSISFMSSVLLRCCGNLMSDTQKKDREMLAANLWQFINEKKIPLDISHYNSLIRVLNENATTFDPQKIFDEIGNAKLKPDRITYQRLIHQYCLQGNITGATSFLEKMKELKFELHEPVFASLIIGYSKQENPPSIDEIFDLMRSNGIEPGSISCTAAIISQAKLIEKNSAAEQELKKVQEFVKRESIVFSINDVTELITNLYSLKKNATVSEIYDNSCATFAGPGNMSSRHRMFCALFSVGDYMKASEFYWSIRPPSQALENSNLGLYYIRLLAAFKLTPIEHSIDECNKMKERGYNKKAFYHLYYFAAKSGNLVLLRKVIEKIGEHDAVYNHYYWPLIAQAKGEKEVVDVLKNCLNPKRAYHLIETFADWVWPHFQDNVTRLFELNKELHYPNSLLVTSYLNHAVKINRTETAIKFIREAPSDLFESRNDQQEENLNKDESGDRYHHRFSMIGLLIKKVAEEKKDPILVKKLFDLSRIPGQPVTPQFCAPLVQVHILNNDIKKAVEVFSEVAEEYRVTPCKSELIDYCLEQKDSQTLQTIMDFSTRVHGENNSLFDLAICCIRTGRIKQAQKIISDPGMWLSSRRVYKTAEVIAKTKDITVLEQFVHICRNSDGINQETLYNILVDAYEKNSCADRALDLWNRLQEEEFPPRGILEMIAKLLEKNNIEVPFRKPQ